MKNFVWGLLILTGCVSQEIVTQKRTELEQLKDQNSTLKNEVANFKKQHKVLTDSLGHAKQLLREKVANDNSKVPYLKFKADSVVIMQCRFASNIEKRRLQLLELCQNQAKGIL
jgi:outer membrane murein-binding lipoprotein Lpp